MGLLRRQFSLIRFESEKSQGWSSSNSSSKARMGWSSLPEGPLRHIHPPASSARSRRQGKWGRHPSIRRHQELLATHHLGQPHREPCAVCRVKAIGPGWGDLGCSTGSFEQDGVKTVLCGPDHMSRAPTDVDECTLKLWQPVCYSLLQFQGTGAT